MLKKILSIIFLLLVLAGIIFYLHHFRAIKHPVSSAIGAIPTNAELIFEVRQPHQLWKKLSETNIIWEELLQTKFIGNLNEQLVFFDSIYTINPSFQEIFNQQPLFISVHTSINKQVNFLFSFNIPATVSPNALNDISSQIATRFPVFSENKKNYDDAEMVSFSSGNKGFSYAVHNRIFVGSSNAMLVEDAIRQLNSGTSLSNDFSFHKVFSTASAGSDGNLLINHSFLPQFISVFAKKELFPHISLMKNFADWTAVDLRLKPNVLMLNGFTFANDSLNKFLSLFKNQKPQNPEFIRIIPHNTNLFFHIGFSNFNTFYKEYKVFIDSQERTEQIQKINAMCHCDAEKTFLSWIENEMAVVFSEPSPNENNFYAVFKIKNRTESEKLLNDISEPLPEKSATATETNELPIKKFVINAVYPVLLGKLFSKLDTTYYCTIDDYLVLSNEKNALHRFIAYEKSQKTLAYNPNFRTFSEELSTESNLLIYTNISRSFNLVNDFFKPDYKKNMEESHGIFSKFESSAIQFSNAQSQLFYCSAILKYNPSSKKETGTIWETMLDTTVTSKPELVLNHYTQAKEIFVQDDANSIYLLSNTGKILWKRLLPEKIKSEIFQIDALNNNKFQLLFNTESFIYLIDRNGKDVRGFPIRPKTTITNGISVFDYEKNKNYRIIVALADSNILNFDQHGKPVDGWLFSKAKAPFHLPFQHFSLNGKDYIVNVDENGNPYAVDRSGKTRVEIKEKLCISHNNNFFIETGKDIGKTRFVATDSTGNIVRLYFTGNIENFKINEFSKEHFFTYRNINDDHSPEYIFADEQKLSVYAQDNIRYPIFDFQTEENVVFSPLVFDVPDWSAKIAVTDSGSGKIYLFDKNGGQVNDFPLFGNTPFSIGDMNNDGNLYLVTASGNNIYAYLIE